jgi:hypothetical protein
MDDIKEKGIHKKKKPIGQERKAHIKVGWERALSQFQIKKELGLYPTFQSTDYGTSFLFKAFDFIFQPIRD